MKYLLLIPARSGSKGVKNKNIFEINGTPLINFTIFSALEVKKKISDIEVIVSTNSKKIKNISLKAGAKVPFLRPNNISGDKAPSKDYINHVIQYYDKIENCPENIIILQPTSPLRNENDIINSIKIYEKKKSKTLISVYKEEYINEKVIYKFKGNHGRPISKYHNFAYRRQDEKPFFVRNGAIYIIEVNFFKKEKKVISNLPSLYIMKKSKSLNIDNYDDLELAKKLLT